MVNPKIKPKELYRVPPGRTLQRYLSWLVSEATASLAAGLVFNIVCQTKKGRKEIDMSSKCPNNKTHN